MLLYTPPDFNLLMSLWRTGAPPLGNPIPVYADIPCAIYLSGWSPAIFSSFQTIRFPVSIGLNYLSADILEAPQGSERYWRVERYFRMHEGFVNEYWACQAYRCTSNGAQIPNPGLP